MAKLTHNESECSDHTHHQFERDIMLIRINKPKTTNNQLIETLRELDSLVTQLEHQTAATE